MSYSRYRVTSAQIGNSSGLLLFAAVCRDHPQFKGVPGQVEVLSNGTMLRRFEPSERQSRRPEEKSLMLGLSSICSPVRC